MAKTLIEDSKEAVPQPNEEDGSMPDQGRYPTTSKVFLRPSCIPNSKEEDSNMGGGSDSMQRSSLECVPVVDYLF